MALVARRALACAQSAICWQCAEQCLLVRWYLLALLQQIDWCLEQQSPGHDPLRFPNRSGRRRAHGRYFQIRYPAYGFLVSGAAHADRDQNRKFDCCVQSSGLPWNSVCPIAHFSCEHRMRPWPGRKPLHNRGVHHPLPPIARRHLASPIKFRPRPRDRQVAQAATCSPSSQPRPRRNLPAARRAARSRGSLSDRS